MAKKSNIYADVYQLARLALIGNKEDIYQFIRKISRTFKIDSPEYSEKIDALLIGGNSDIFRSIDINNIPVDKDNRLELLQYHDPIPPSHDPIWSESIQSILEQILLENTSRKILAAHNIEASKSLIFYGPPGVGKTFAAKWLAWKLNLPLLTLNLSSVMSSFLGRTGNNIKSVFEYAKKFPSVLLLDEFDAIAKLRDDPSEIGELKRLVTVLLQEIDNWPDSNILIAATNHPGLLDPAIWRRFDVLVEFVKPSDYSYVNRAISLFFGNYAGKICNIDLLISVLKDYSYSDIERFSLQTLRRALVYQRDINTLIDEFIITQIKTVAISQRKDMVVQLYERGYSQRKISSLLDLSRPTIKKILEGLDHGGKQN